MKKNEKKKFRNWMRRIYCLVSIAAMEGGMQLSVYAAEPQFVTGTKKLIDDLTNYLLGMAAAVTVALLIKACYQWNLASDEEKPRQKKVIFVTLVAGVGTIVAGSIVKWIFSYYQ